MGTFLKEWSTWRGVLVGASVVLPQVGVAVEAVDAVVTAAVAGIAVFDVAPDVIKKGQENG